MKYVPCLDYATIYPSLPGTGPNEVVKCWAHQLKIESCPTPDECHFQIFKIDPNILHGVDMSNKDVVEKKIAHLEEEKQKYDETDDVYKYFDFVIKELTAEYNARYSTVTLSSILGELISEKEKIKKERDKYPKDSEEYQRLNGVSKEMKNIGFGRL